MNLEKAAGDSLETIYLECWERRTILSLTAAVGDNWETIYLDSWENHLEPGGSCWRQLGSCAAKHYGECHAIHFDSVNKNSKSLVLNAKYHISFLLTLCFEPITGLILLIVNVVSFTFKSNR